MNRNNIDNSLGITHSNRQIVKRGFGIKRVTGTITIQVKPTNLPKEHEKNGSGNGDDEPK